MGNMKKIITCDLITRPTFDDVKNQLLNRYCQSYHDENGNKKFDHKMILMLKKYTIFEVWIIRLSKRREGGLKGRISRS